MRSRTVPLVIGVVGLLVGLLWVGQGLGYLPGSFMTGDRTWFWVGLLVAVLSLFLLVRGLRPPRQR